MKHLASRLDLEKKLKKGIRSVRGNINIYALDRMRPLDKPINCVLGENKNETKQKILVANKVPCLIMFALQTRFNAIEFGQ